MALFGLSVQARLRGLYPRLRRFARMLTLDRDAADDLVERTCLPLLERDEELGRGDSFAREVFSRLHSEWIGDLRSNRIRIGDGGEGGDGVLVEPGDAGELDEDAGQALVRLAKLPPQQRAALLLVYGEGFSYDDAAEILDTTGATVLSRIARGRMAIARELGLAETVPAPAAPVEPLRQAGKAGVA